MIRTERYGRRMVAAVSALGLFAPGLLRAQQAPDMAAHEKALYEAARAKNEQVTWYTSSYSSETADALIRAFTEIYPGVRANVVRTTAQVAYQRLSQDIRANAQNCDVFTSTDISHLVLLKDDGRLEKFVPENATHLIEAFRGLDPEGFYHTTGAGTVLINYNTAQVAAENMPRNWTDLLDLKWRNQVAVGHPSYSGYVGTWVVAMRNLYGWEFFEKLEKNRPQIGRSIIDTVTMLNSGERMVGAGSGATTLRIASRGNPLAVSYPEDGTVLMIAPSGIVKGTGNPSAARLFLEFLLGKRANEVSAEHFYDVVRADVQSYPGARNLSEIKTIRPTIKEIEKGIPEVKELWRDTFGV
jgi:iron(III) transport system substrate-binding protein